MWKRRIRLHFTVWLLLLGLCSVFGAPGVVPRALAAAAVTIDSPADGTPVGSRTIRITGTYQDVYDLVLLIDGKRQAEVRKEDPDGDDSGSWYYDLDTSAFNGPVRIIAKGLDVNTRYGVWSRTLTLLASNPARTAPVVRIDNPQEGKGLTGEVPVQISVDSPNAVQRVDVRINGGPWEAADRKGDHYQYIWQTQDIGERTSSIEAKAVDDRGNTGFSMTTYAQVGKGTDEPVTVEKQDRAMWIWEPASYNLLLNPGSRTVLDAMAEDTATFGSDPVTVFYIAVGSYGGIDILEDNREAVRDFLTWAHARGYQVFACIAGGTSPPYMGADTEYHPLALRQLEKIINYNIASPAGARFDGVNVDIEPYISPDFKAQYPSLQKQYLDLSKKMADRRDAAGIDLPIGPAIPKWYDSSNESRNIEWNGATKWLSEHIQDISDYISIMDYRDTADGTAGIIAGAEGEIAYAAKIGKPNSVVIGVETLDIANSGDPETITFREEGRTAMETELDKVYAAFGSKPGFGGIAMHHYDSLRALPSHWGPGAVFWQPPADTEPPTAVSRNPVATATDCSTVQLSYGIAFDNTEVDKYVVYRSTQPGFTAGAATAVGTARSLSFKDTGLLPNTTYYYKIAAMDVRGNVGPASAETQVTTGTTALKPMIVSELQVVRSGNSASAALQVVDKATGQPVTAEVYGRFTYAGGKYTGGLATGGAITLVSEALPQTAQVGFEPRRITAAGYYWAQAYDAPHTAALYPRVRLQGLSLSAGALEPSFAPDRLQYTASVSADTYRLAVTARPESVNAAVFVNGALVTPGAPAEVALQPGANRITVRTAGPDGTTDSYTITVNRAAVGSNTLRPVADAYIFENAPTENYGSAELLDIIDAPRAAGGGDRLALMKFNFGAYPEPVHSAKLYVYVPAAPAVAVPIAVQGLTTDNWSEETVNWNNRPGGTGVSIGTLQVAQSGWYGIDVTSFLQSRTDGIATFRLADTNTKNSLVQLHSKEHTEHQPYVVINP